MSVIGPSVEDYHGHQFVDGQGESFRAVACFAPYSKAPRQRVNKEWAPAGELAIDIFMDSIDVELDV